MVADALSSRYALISVLRAKLLGLQSMEAYYSEDSTLQELEKSTPAQGPYLMQVKFVFKGNKLRVPTCSSRELLVKEAHRGSLAGYFRLNKT